MEFKQAKTYKNHEHSSDTLLYVGFNQDHQCFACGTDTGFRIYNCDPLRETFQRDFQKGGIGYVEMLFRCNIMALVGGGKNPRFSPNKVMIWDDHQGRCIGELSFRSPVQAVKLRRDRVVVVLEFKIYVYNFTDLKLVDHIETCSNAKGIVALCPAVANNVLACPGLQKGHVRIELYEQKKTTLIEAHENALACLALNQEGTLLATASETGTLIRIFDTARGVSLQELRRGADRAEIYCIAFHSNSQWLATSSDKGTIHIFNLKLNQEQLRHQRQLDDNSIEHGAAANPTSSLSFMKSFLPKYFSSEWSFAQYRVPETKRTIVAFSSADEQPLSHQAHLIVLSLDGHYYKAAFTTDAPGHECVQVDYAHFGDTIQAP